MFCFCQEGTVAVKRPQLRLQRDDAGSQCQSDWPNVAHEHANPTLKILKQYQSFHASLDVAAGNIQKLTVTTPLFYANGSPHMGHSTGAV